MIRTGRSMGNDAISSSGIIGIKPPGNAIAQGVFHRGPGKSAYGSGRCKRAFKDEPKSLSLIHILQAYERGEHPPVVSFGTIEERK